MSKEILFKCSKCSTIYHEPRIICPKCNGLVLTHYSRPKHLEIHGEYEGIWKLKKHLPPIPFNYVVSLDEGSTPLLKIENFASKIKYKGKILVKDETRNPTGSFRDRVATVIVSHALYVGAKKLICATDGNTGASIAAYAAKAGIECTAIVPKNADYGKILQMIAYGSKILEHGEIIDEAVLKALQISLANNYYQATAELNPLSIEGLKTISYEILMKMKNVPEWIVTPAGSGLTLLSLALGFKELHELGFVKKKPRFLIVQSLACSPIVDAIEKSEKETMIKEFKKHIPGLDSCKPLILPHVIKLAKEYECRGVRVSYVETLNHVDAIAKLEGLFLEPAAASAFAGLAKAVKEGIIEGDEEIVVLAPATGLKASMLYAREPSRKKYVPKLSGINTKAMILEVLKSKGPMHGYGLWKELGLMLSVQAIYQHLEELRRKGLVKVEVKGRRKIYSLTDKGLRISEVLGKI
ncbi:MAG: hypothetical protein B6U75_02270 [Desulfurococcales archaeon ex4484_217_1]|nr:MAG: hypothetical protein B6U75_02270 [Desulfurococcales archaeon ex4484_217_1]